jgi:hydrogenase maturation protease
VPAVTVFGLGNILHSDDGLGPYVVKVLEAEYEFPPEVEVLDAGTPGLELSTILEDAGALIIVDTVRSDGAGGELRTYSRDEILKHPPAQRITPHDPGLKETLLVLELQGETPPEVFVIGVIPESIEYGVGLTDAVREAVPAVVAEIIGELERLGYPVEKRQPPLDPDIWWERQPGA